MKINQYFEKTRNGENTGRRVWKRLVPVCSAVLALCLTVTAALPFGARAAQHSGDARRDPDLVLRNYDPDGDARHAFGTTILKEKVNSIVFLDSLEEAPRLTKDVSETGNGRVLLWSEHVKDGYYRLYIAGDGKVIFPEDCSFLFGGRNAPKEQVVTFAYLKSLDFGDAVDTSGVTDMTAMFQYSNALRSLDLSSFDTGSVTDMDFMFCGCSRIRDLDLTGFRTDNVVKMQTMFSGCCSLKELDVTMFNTENVENMSWMFGSCGKLTSLDLRSFTTDHVEAMDCMFHSCSEDLELQTFNDDIQDQFDKEMK